MAKTIVGIDVGGTFTDIAVPNFGSGRRLADGYDAGHTNRRAGERDAYGNSLLERAS